MPVALRTKLAAPGPAEISRPVSDLQTDPRTPLVQRATSGLYAPGSTFKTVTVAAALQRGIATADTVYEDAGSITIDDHTLV